MVNSKVFISLVVLLLTVLSKVNSDDTIDVQGSIFCLSDNGNKATPINGATAKIICKSSDGGDLSIISSPTNANGFYNAMMSSNRGSKLRKCKAFLNSSPLPGCSSPNNINGGKSGSKLLPFSSSDRSRNRHFSVKPFFYSNA